MKLIPFITSITNEVVCINPMHITAIHKDNNNDTIIHLVSGKKILVNHIFEDVIEIVNHFLETGE